MPSAYQLINTFFTKNRLESSTRSGSMPFHPFVTVARDPGSGGKPIAKLIATKLNYKFYDDALIEAISKSAKKRSKIVREVDEKTRSAIEDLVHNLFNPEYLSDTTYIKHLTNTMLSIAHQGKAVILGRGANFITPPDKGLHVLVTAPRHVRIKRAVQYEHINKLIAIRRIEKISNERRSFVSQYFNRDYSNPKYYDLIINTEFFSVDTASDLIISAFRKKFPSLGEKLKTVLKKKSRLY